MNGSAPYSLQPPGTSPARVHRQWLSLGLVLVFSVMAQGCEEVSVPLEPIAVETTTELTPGGPVAFELSGYEADVLLVRVSGFEAALVSDIVDVNGQVISRAQIPYLRGIPLFHVIDHESDDHASQVLVKPEDLTKNALLNISVFEMPKGSGREKERIKAYLAYEAATRATDDESPELWRSRAALLDEAAVGFKRSGDDESLLWAEYLSAFIHYFPLADYETAARKARQIQAQAASHGFRQIELMALQLEGQVLIERNREDDPDEAQVKAERGQVILERAASLAAETNYAYEQAYALNSRGIGYFYQGQLDKSEQFHELALSSALDLEDLSLESQVRGNLALVHERQGDLYGALDELKAINVPLSKAGDTANLAHNWTELGRLYDRLYLFGESIEAQGRALEFWRALNSAEGKGRSGLSLAHAYQAIGNPEMALSVLNEALANLELAGFARGLREGLGLKARLHRGLGQYSDMAEARDNQGDLLISDQHRAVFLYEKGLDVRSQDPANSANAATFFRQAEAAASEAQYFGLAVRSRLHRCAIASHPDDNCSTADLESGLDKMALTATTSHVLEARVLFAQILVRSGEFKRAWSVADALIDDIQLYRQTLPGVLGAWYWEGRVEIFELYLALALREAEQSKEGAARSLLAFNRLLNTAINITDKSNNGFEVRDQVDIVDLRALLAQLESRSDTESLQVRTEIDRRLLRFRKDVAGTKEAISVGDFDSFLAGLPSNAGLLAYYLSEDEAWAWLAMQGDVRVVRLASGQEILAALQRTRSGLRMVGNNRLNEELNTLGDLLLPPLGVEMPETIYLLNGGPLAGFPFDVIRNEGRFLGEDHVVINVLSLNALGSDTQIEHEGDEWREIMLVGDPLLRQRGQSALPSASHELAGLASLLEGRKITRATREQLDEGLFNKPAFLNADVVHIASHAKINLHYPELSRLLIASDSQRPSFLTPMDLYGQSVNASLVTLSACETSGVNQFSFDSNLGFVSAFLQAGSDSVVAALWPVGDAATANFMLAFYALMLEGKSAPAALAQVKRRLVPESEPNGPPAWAAFQIYVN